MRATLRSFTFGVTLAAATYFLVSVVADLPENVWTFLGRVLAPVAVVGVSILLAVSYTWRRITKKTISINAVVLGLFLIAVGLSPIIKVSRYFFLEIPNSSNVRAPLRLLSINLLGHRNLIPELVAEINQRTPDVILIQELNPETALFISTELRDKYPCQLLDPKPSSWGMGAISSLPCKPIEFSPSGRWVGIPQIMQVTTSTGQQALVVNIHALHPHARTPIPESSNILSEFSSTVTARYQAIEELLTYLARFRDVPVVMAGDFNSTMRNQTYSLIRDAGFNDAWLSTHSLASSIFNSGTWPFAEVSKTALLSWLLRIDFIFYDPRLTPERVELLPQSLGSDHKGLFSIFR